MKTLFVESSAILAWLFHEPEGERVAEHLERAETVTASALVRLEVERTIVRQVALRKRTEADAGRMRGTLAREMARWNVLDLSDEVLARAARSFPSEPLRALDAIHLATALELVPAFPELGVLSLDRRVTANVRALGLDLAE